MSKPQLYCPQCTPQERLVDDECPRCAYGVPKQGRRDREAATARGKHDGGCDFRHNGMRCPFPGTSSPNIRAGGPWYCRHHSREENRMPDEDHIGWFAKFLHSPDAQANRKAQCALWYPSTARRVAMAECRASGPEARRRDDETLAEYVQRMRTIGKAMAGELLRKAAENRRGAPPPDDVLVR